MIEQTKRTADHDRYTRPPDWRLVLGIVLTFLLVLLMLLRCTQQEMAYYVENEVLLSGPLEDVAAVGAAVRKELAGQDIQFTLVDSPTLSFAALGVKGCASLPAGLAGVDEYAIFRYRVSGGKLQVEEAIARLQETAGDRAVRPEPNYLTSSPWSIGGSPWSIGGSPWSIGGSPWSIGGSPWSIGGSPWSIGGSPSGHEVGVAANEAFRSQWAFGRDGIRLVGASPNRPLGQGILVGIFDTSPFPVTVSRAILATDPPFEIELQHLLPGGPFAHLDTIPDMRDHGLFAAGLVHAVAPASQIRLVRVLDNEGQGDVQALNKALVAFLQDVAARKRDATLRGAVINLSLGLHPPPDAAERGLPAEVSSLQTVLAVAGCLDIVTVAAAGNDSAGLPAHLPAQIPASWPSTIGVAASNARGELACFSNQGEILAPGGDGGPNPGACKPLFHRCDDDCPYALISLSLASPSGYRYWAGTSFSTPLVSGLAAAVEDSGGGWVPLPAVRGRLVAGGRPSTIAGGYAGVAPNTGVVIDVPGTTP